MATVAKLRARAYAPDLDQALGPLASVTGVPAGIRFSLPNGLELAAFGDVLALGLGLQVNTYLYLTCLVDEMRGARSIGHV